MEFGTISETYPNPPSSKPWAIAQGFWSKLPDNGPMEIFPKFSRIVSYTVRNPFASILTIFYGVWDDFRDLPKSAIFKTMGYGPGFLVKIAR